ncbi:MAG: MFS transporter [Planctomycetota bacterium]|nr:MFS transporter [Planctomycetota bacterium]
MIKTESSKLDDKEPGANSSQVYNVSLLMAFLANVFQLIAVSLLFRYSDFVNVLGGDEWHLGWIVGIASFGAIACRLIQGTAIDRFGPGMVWIISLLVEIVAILWHLGIDSVSGVEVYLARSLFAMSLAGTFGAWISFISLQAPHQRIAEVIGVIGSSGFVGMAIGPTIGDWLFAESGTYAEKVEQMFHVAAITATISLLFAVLAWWLAHRRGVLKPNPRAAFENPLRVIWNSQPGFILVIGMLMGLTIGFPGTYLRPFAESLNIENIKSFFIIYNVVAFVSRLLFRNAPQVLGLSNTILLGFGFMALSMSLYLPMQSRDGFWLPATAGGLAHCFLFPSVVAACTNRFTKLHRGIATQLILGMYDLGVLIGMPVIGYLVIEARAKGLDPYPFTIKSLLGTIVTISLIYLLIEKWKNRQVAAPPESSSSSSGSNQA